MDYRDDPMGVLRLVPQDTTESWIPLLEKKLETSVVRSVDLGGIRHMFGALPEFQVSPTSYQGRLQWHLRFRF